jgi:hypothetical protein
MIAKPSLSELDQILAADSIQSARCKNVVKSARYHLTFPCKVPAKFLFLVTVNLAEYVPEIKLSETR